MGAPAVSPYNDRNMLGVARSLTGRGWTARDSDARIGMAMAQRLGVPEIVGRAMTARGVALQDADTYLNPTLRALMPDPHCLKDMDVAARRLADAVMRGESIAVFGDYDVDGATSSALLARFFAAAGAPLRIYIPDRQREGYGPNSRAMLRLKAEGIGVVVTVDCGTHAFEPLQIAAEAGLEVIVVDHHLAPQELPQAVAVVNPKRLDDDSGLDHLAAVGVAFLLVVAVNRVLRKAEWYAKRAEPDLLSWLDIVALGTVCDQVPLIGLNRALVAQGLRVLAERGNVGLAALSDVAKANVTPGAYDLGFLLGPRVNAGGRVGESQMGACLLSTQDRGEAARIAAALDAYNTERRSIEHDVLDEALAQAKRDGPLVFVAGEAWHPGVIGIVASRLVERHRRPACVVSLDGDLGKGSGRSVDGVDLGAAVLAAREAGLLRDGGGHAMAAGFTVERGQLDALRTFLADRVAHDIRVHGVVPTLRLDGAVSVRGADAALVEALALLSPFGRGNAEPRFALPSVRVVKADVVGADHVRCIVTDSGGGSLKAMAFRAAGEPIGQALMGSAGRAIHLAGRLRADTWRGGGAVELLVDDAAWP